MFGGVFFMAKYSKELKLEIINFMKEFHASPYAAQKKYNINEAVIRIWLRRYELYGIDGLVYKNTKYDGNFKISVVEYMHKNHLSLNETCIKFRINSVSNLSKWERIYYEEGPQALFRDLRGKRRKMSSKVNKQNLSKNQDEKLIEELEYLRAENAYLKKLDALVQERIKRENKKKQ